MTRRQDLEHRLRSLTEIRSIMGAMKSLALVEIRKLSRMHASHGRVVETLHTAMADFFAYHPQFYPPPAQGAPLVLLIGSERGFCGSFNQVLVEGAERHLDVMGHAGARFIAVGHKLGVRLEGDPRVIAQANGPSAAEEVSTVLTGLLASVQEIAALQGGLTELALWAAFHDPEAGGVRMENLMAFPAPASPGRHRSPPHVPLPPHVFLPELISHYLFSLLAHLSYASLMAENRARLAHMEAATHRLERRTEELTLHRNLLRQEEITQEMELILLSAEQTRAL